MTDYEKLLDEAVESGVTVIEKYPFESERIKGLYGDNFIALSNSLETTAESRSVLLEELGHHATSSGSIIDQNSATSRKQERHARIWAYRRAVGLADLITAYKRGCRNAYEIAEHLNITTDLLFDAIDYYKSHYGTYTTVDNYLIFFVPLGVLELNI